MVLWQEAGNNPVAALAAAEGLANADGLKSRGSIRIMSAVEEAQLAEERRIRRREQVRPASSLDVFSKAVRACLQSALSTRSLSFDRAGEGAAEALQAASQRDGEWLQVGNRAQDGVRQVRCQRAHAYQQGAATLTAPTYTMTGVEPSVLCSYAWRLSAHVGWRSTFICPTDLSHVRQDHRQRVKRLPRSKGAASSEPQDQDRCESTGGR